MSGSPEPLTDSFPALPTETEIYILPDGRVVIADLPVELAGLATQLGLPEPCEIEPAHADANPAA